MAANLLLRPKARQRFGIMAVLLLSAGVMMLLAFVFGLWGVHLLLVQHFGAPIGTLLTGAALFLLAFCFLIGVIIVGRRTPPPPLIDTQTMAMLGVLAGLAGIEAFSAVQNNKKS